MTATRVAVGSVPTVFSGPLMTAGAPSALAHVGFAAQAAADHHNRTAAATDCHTHR